MKNLTLTKKLIALLTLSTAMSAFAPVYAQFSTGGSSYTTLAEALAAVADGATITMTQDVVSTATSRLDVAKTYTFDLGGHTLSTSSVQNHFAISNGTVTVKNGSITNTYATYPTAITASGTATRVTLDNLTVTASYRAVNVTGSAAVTLMAGRFTGALSGQISIAPGYASNIYPWQNAGDITIAAGTPPANFQIGANTYSSLDEAIAAVSDGETITMLKNISVIALVNLNVAKTYTLDLGGHTFSASSQNFLYISTGTVSIQNGNITNSNSSGYAIYLSAAAANVTLDNLTVNSSFTAVHIFNGILSILSGNYSATSGETLYCAGGTTTIISGNFFGTDRAALYGGNNVTIREGYFKTTSASYGCMSGTVNQIQLEPGAAATPSLASLNTSVKEVTVTMSEQEPNFETGGKVYTTLQSVLSAVLSGGTITMLRDINEAETINSNKTCTIDLGGNTISMTGSVTNFFNITAGTLTVKNGSITNPYSSGRGIYVNGAAASAILDRLTVNAGFTAVYVSGGNASILSGDYSALYRSVYVGDNGKATITSGHFTSVNDASISTISGGQILLAEGSVPSVSSWLNSARDVTITAALFKISAGTVNRTSNTEATIGFSADKAGTAYYLVKNSGATEPTTTEVKAGTSLGAVPAGTVSGKAVTLTIGAKDIYIVVEDAASNLSNVLKIAVAAMSSFETGGNIYATLEEAAAAVVAGGTITMLRDVEMTATSTLNLSKTYTFDLGGYTLGMANIDNNIMQINSGTVTIQNGSITLNVFGVNCIRVNGGNVILDNLSVSKTMAGAAVYVMSGTLSILSGNYISSTLPAVNCTGGTVTIASGKFTSLDSALKESDSGQILLAAGSTADVNPWKNDASAKNVEIVLFAISAGTVNRTSDTQAIIGFTTGRAGTAYYLVKLAGNPAPTTAEVKAGTSLGAVPAGTVSGKIVNLAAGEYDIYIVVEDAGNIHSNLLKIAVAEYFESNFETGGNIYRTLEDAIDAVAIGDTITMLQDVSVSDRISLYRGIEKNYTIDLGGYTLSNDVTEITLHIEIDTMEPTGTITIQNGSLINTVSGGKCISVMSGTVILDKLTANAFIPVDVSDERSVVSILSGNYTGEEGVVLCLDGTVTITSGHFVSTVNSYGNGCLKESSSDGEGKILLASGSAADKDPWKNSEDVTDVTISVLPNFTTGGNAYETLYDAVAAVADGGTITMLRNVSTSVGDVLDVAKTYIVDLGGNTFSNAGHVIEMIRISLGNVTIQNGYITNSEGDAIEVGLNAVVTLSALTVNTKDIVIRNGGALSILSGDYAGNNDAIYCTAGTVTITSGHFAVTDDKFNDGCLVTKGSGQILLASGSTADKDPWKNSASATEVTIIRANFETGGNGYITLEEAIAAVAEGGTITMLQNVELSATPNLNKNKTYTIDFDGYTLSNAVSLIETVRITSGNITLKNGSITTTITGWTGISIDNATVTLDNLTINAKITAVANNSGTLFILSGDYTAGDDAVYSPYSTTTITSGHFTATNDTGNGCIFGRQIVLAQGSTADIDPWKDNASATDVTITTVTTGVVETQCIAYPQVIGYYSILGQKLPKEPQSGIYMIRYDNGTAKKIIK